MIKSGAVPLAAGEKVRVLVVDDSVVMRNIISRILAAEPSLQVVGTARDGVDALAKVNIYRPHVVTLDVEMPELDGLGALRRIKEHHHSVRVLMLSSHTAKGAQVTVEALIQGASDYVTKPQYGDKSGEAFQALGKELLGKIRQLFFREEAPEDAPAPRPAARPVPRPAAVPSAPVWSPTSCAEIFAIGVSTGGPAALSDALPMIPADFPLPIAIVQHMPPDFTRLLAERLTKLCRIRVVEGEEGMIAAPGTAVIAPGGQHMRLVRANGQFVVKLDSGPAENSCRPAVDVLFRSLAECCSGRVVAAVLTGMGQDGLAGARALKQLGGKVIVQDQATSVIWGMPGAIARANLADSVLPLHQIIPDVLARVGHA